MNFRSAFIQGWQSSWKYRPVVGWLYLLILAAALLVVMPLQSLLESKAGHSLMLAELLEGFNYTFLNDFKNAYGAGISPILQVSVLALSIFLLLFLFLAGGTLVTLQRYPGRFDRSVFWSASARYFWRMLRLSVYFLLMQAGLLVLVGWIYLKVTKGLSLAELEDDRLILGTLRWLLPPYFLLMIFLLCWQDYTRMIVVKNESRWLFHPIWSAFHFLRRHFLMAYGMYLLYWLLLIACLLAQSYWVDPGSSWLAFLLVQLFLILRLSIRVANWGSVWRVVRTMQ